MTDLQRIRINPYEIRNIKHSSKKLWITALKKDFSLIFFLNKILFEEIKEEIKENISPSSFLQYCYEEGIKMNFSEEFLMNAVKQDGRALRYVKNQTPEICLEAEKEDGWALEYVKNQTPEICLAAIKENSAAIQYVKEQTPEICKIAILKDLKSLEYSLFQDEKIILRSLKKIESKNPINVNIFFNFEYVRNQTKDFIIKISRVIKHIPRGINEFTPEIIESITILNQKENISTYFFVKEMKDYPKKKKKFFRILSKTSLDCQLFWNILLK